MCYHPFLVRRCVTALECILSKNWTLLTKLSIHKSTDQENETKSVDR